MVDQNTAKAFLEIFSAATLTLIGRIFASVLGLIVSIIIARKFGPEMTGFLGIVGAWALLFAYPAAFGFQASILRLIPEFRSKYSSYPLKRLFNYVIFFVLIMAMISALIFILLNAFWPKFIRLDLVGEKRAVLHVSILILLKAVLLVATNGLRAFGFNKAFAFFQLFTPLINLVGLLVLIPVLGDISPLYALILSFLVPVIFSIFFVNSTWPTIEGPQSSAQIQFTKILKISFPMMIAGYVGILASELGVLLLGAHATVEEVGLYVIAFKISFIPAMLLKAVNAVISPKISELYFSGDIDLMFTLCRLFTFFSTFFAGLFLVIFFYFGEQLFSVIYGDAFIGSSPILMVLLVAQFINAATGSSGDLMQMTEDEKTHRDVTIYGVIVYLAASFMLIPYLGALGIAIALVLAEIVWNGVALMFIFRKFRQLPLPRLSEVIAVGQTQFFK